MLRKFLLIISVGMAVFGAAIVANASTFDGNPAAPLPVTTGYTDAGDGATWDIQVHSRDIATWYALEGIDAQHGADCSAPPATHHNTSYEGAVFQCRDHVMTAINAGGYGVIYLTPNRLFDFSQGGSVQFDLSTERMSGRDWWDLTIQPWANNMALPLDGVAVGVDLQGQAPNSINVSIDNGQGAPTLSLIRDGVQEYNSFGFWPPFNHDITAGTNQAATRQTFKLTIANGRMKFERLASATAPALVFWDVAETVNFSSGIVQFGHHSYNPTKDSAGVPATWHWDNISVEPSSPFTIIKADRRYTEGGSVGFASPAPSGAFLRFSAVCDVRVDGTPVSPVKPPMDEAKFSSYFVPIAAGTQNVNVGLLSDGWDYTGPCLAKDFSIWSLSSSTSPTVAPEITSTPTPTSTPSATNTNTPTPVSSTATPTSTATSTPVPPTATPTPAPVNARCTVRDRNDANTGWREVEGVWVEIAPNAWTCAVTSVGRVP